jgi:hypothetical protein
LLSADDKLRRRCDDQRTNQKRENRVRKRLLGQLLRELSTALFHAQKLNVDGAEIALVRIEDRGRPVRSEMGKEIRRRCP